MLKILLLIGVLSLIYFFFFKKKPLTPPTQEHKQDEEMIACSTCGTYVQTKDMLTYNGKHYCSHECMKGSE